MTEVLVEEELELTSIVEVVQTKLVKNFTTLLKRINKNGEEMISHTTSTQQQFQNTHQTIQQLRQLVERQQVSHSRTVRDLSQKIYNIERDQKNVNESVQEMPLSIKRINDELFNTQLQFEQKMKEKEQEMQEMMKHIRTLALDQNRISDEINKKENIVEAEKMVKETEILKNKNNHIENELKLATHKIEKIQILKEKADRLQAKKDVEFMREIEERVKKELKVNIGSNGNIPSQTNSYNLIQNSSTGTPAYKQSGFVSGQSQKNIDVKRVTSILSQELSGTCNLNETAVLRSDMQHIIQKWSDKIKYFDVQFREVNENLKALNRASHKTNNGNKQNNSDMMKDRINEIKPELVKMWAKIDTIDDRLSFSERKTEQKLKGINQLASLVKQNNFSRLDEKMKGLQTQIFTSLKEIKTKLETKVNQPEYDKYRQQMEEKIGQITDLIYLKSDKLEVKKALLFLESKVKEIILVISEDEENQKDALLTKKQLKCISCDKDLDKFSGVVSSPKGNWDSLPYKEHPPEILGRFGMTNFGSLAKKIKKLESKDLPILNKRNINQSFQNS